MTDATPSRAVMLHGTDEPVPDMRRLTAGPLDVWLDDGNLRDIRVHGEEVIRAVSFIIRDGEWATLVPEIADLDIQQDVDRFVVRYTARVTGFTYTACIEGRSDGTLDFSAEGTSPEGMRTCRTGFVVLHPLALGGRGAEIAHTDGSIEETAFPQTLQPWQPMMDLRRITHTTDGGQKVSCVMEGEAYEMEDQRNWTDASFKTYVRPLAKPWPYEIPPGETLSQRVSLAVEGAAPDVAGRSRPVVARGGGGGTMPRLGMGLAPEDAAETSAHADRLRPLGMSHLICHYDPRSDHDTTTLRAQIAAAAAVGAEPWLEAVVAAVEDDAAVAEVAALGRLVDDLDRPFGTVLLSPAPDLKCTLPGSDWPPAPDAAGLYRAARTAFPNARIGGGMFSFFTELNRKRPPTEALDLVTFTTAAVFHAGDDRSVMQTLQTLPVIAETVPEIAGGLPWHVGPSSIGMRANPYGEAPLPNPKNVRQAVNHNDPRQRGLMGAAWTLGHVAAFALGGAQAVTVGAPVGPFGTVSVPMDYPQPGFSGDGELYPVWHVLRGLARLQGAPIRALSVDADDRIVGLAGEAEGAEEIWLANTTAQSVTIDLDLGGAWTCARLDETTFAASGRDPDLMVGDRDSVAESLSLAAYAVIRLTKEG